MKRIALLLALATVGCESVRSHTPTWLGGEEAAPSANSGSAVYYSGVADLRVFAEPSAASKVVGSLSLHQKVRRSKIDRGYAWIESADGRLRGWVNNGQLIWKLPSSPAAVDDGKDSEPASKPITAPPAAAEPPAREAAPPVESEPAAVEPAAAEVQDEAPTPVRRPPSKKPSDGQNGDGGVAPSVLDAY